MYFVTNGKFSIAKVNVVDKKTKTVFEVEQFISEQLIKFD